MDGTKIVAVLGLLVVGGCTLQRPIPPLRLAGETALPTEPAPAAPVDPLTLEPAAVQTATHAYQQSGKAPVIAGDRVLYPFELTKRPPTLICAPLHVSDLTLGPGETVTDVATGDSERWLIEVAGGGNPQDPMPHVLIKPKDAPLRTNLVIMTTQHTYRLDLVARRTDHFTQAAGFYFPKELLAASEQATKGAADPKPIVPRSLIADLGMREINLNYQVSGPDVPFRPLRAFDDGTHTYLQMPAGMKAAEAPALLVATPSGDNSLVNYRIAGNYYVIDRLFDQAVLLAGVGSSRDRVSITYTGGPRGSGEGA
jgi:type IV secretion system protein VirB9